MRLTKVKYFQRKKKLLKGSLFDAKRKHSLPKLLQIEDIKAKLPIRDTYRTPNISYKYTPTIRSKVTNYHDVIFSDSCHENMTCNCEQSAYKDSHHQHVLTGNLDIVRNTELRSVLSKGLNYREMEPANKRKALEAIKVGITSYIEKLSALIKKPLSYFDSWKNTILSKAKRSLHKTKKHAFSKV